MKYILLFALISATNASATRPLETCSSSKEFITTYNFLKTKNELRLDDKDIHSLSLKVSAGCNNSAKRFLRVFETLSKAEVDSKSSLDYALKYSLLSDAATEAFLAIFKESFLKDFLDLDIKTSLALADKIVPTDEKDIKTTKEDFQNIVKFCNKSSGMELNGKKCSQLAVSIINSSIKYKSSAYTVFEKSFTFLTQQKTVNMPSYKALDLAKQITQNGPKSFENFKEAYLFLNKKESYSKDQKYLIESALDISKQSFKEGQ